MNLNTLVLKIASRCNLNCTYCFMYNLGDETYKKQPKFMSYETMDAILDKTALFIKKYEKKSFSFIFHGGEPLLMKRAFFRTFVNKAKGIEKQLDVDFNFVVQTNAVLIDKEWCDLFKDLDIQVGISVDGTQKAHDMYRIDKKGKGSYDRVVNGLKTVKRALNSANIICVLNVLESPINVYKNFKELDITSANILLTDYTHDQFPYKKNETPTADWLIEFFDLWINDKDKFSVSMFIALIANILGITPDSEEKSNEALALVVETNGELETIDSMKACGHGFTKTGLNIATNHLDDILKTPLGKLYFENSNKKLCGQCEQCPVVQICKGGRLVHRYKKENGFNNPSVYCNDLIKFIAHIQNTLMEKLPDLHDSNIVMMDATEIISYLNTISKHSSKAIHKEELEFFSV